MTVGRRIFQAALASGFPEGTALEIPKLYTLAEALDACVNWDGTSAGTPLSSAATDGSSAPTNTPDTAINIVPNLAANRATIFGLASGKSPFRPTLSAALNDWTMSITYGGGGLDQPVRLRSIRPAGSGGANYFGAIF